jgi:diguanylate cyclase (GGDEF)-like protein
LLKRLRDTPATPAACALVASEYYASSGRPSVLVVEDDAIVAKDIQQTLVELGYQVVAVVRTGRAALRAVGHSQPNLVLSDIRLRGDLDGIELASTIRERYGTPVVFLSSYSDDATLSRIGAAGSYGYLMKPFRNAELRASLELALRRRELDDALQQQALTDELTGLYNRRGFLALAAQQLKIASRSARQVMLVFADVNGLKSVNDALGHEAGDRLLVAAAGALRGTFRDSDIVARLGGDEFAALLVDPESSAQRIIERRIHAAVRGYNRLAEPASALTLSLGVCVWNPEVHRSLADLLAEADRKMYQAKAVHTSRAPKAVT